MSRAPWSLDNAVMDSVPEQRQLAGALPDETEAGARGQVRLIRFTIHPERRGELVDAAPSPVSSGGMLLGSGWRLLVELEDGDWLDVSITGSGRGSDDGSAYLDLADGILGDEEGVVVGCARVDHDLPSPSGHNGPG